MDTLIEFQDAIEELQSVFLDGHNDLFFTEKDLHAHFYHLCQKNIPHHKGYNLVHTEYPTPFKCQKVEDEPYIKLIPDIDKGQRAHIDIVLLNPNYIDFAIARHIHDHSKYISGVGNALFQKHIKELRKSYFDFSKTTGESILLYALEFKYFRHSYSGDRYPKKEVTQDINKLRLVLNNSTYSAFSFCQCVQSIVFTGARASSNLISNLEAIAMNSNRICKLCIRKRA